jgi:leucine dehydrogenase
MSDIEYILPKKFGINLPAVIAIFKGSHLQSIGGCRYAEYESLEKMKMNAAELARSMNKKIAILGLPYNGAKSILLKEPWQNEKTLFKEFGKFVNHLEGRYITGCDVGTTPWHMNIVQSMTSYVSGIPENKTFDEMSYMTAKGCVFSIVSSMQRIGINSFRGLHIVVVGLGKVGSYITKMLLDEGVIVFGFDIQKSKLESIKNKNFRPLKDYEEIFSRHFDVIMPCALGGAITREFIDKINTTLICGAANNQLESEDIMNLLNQRRINYVPDYIANCGGVFLAINKVNGKKNLTSLEGSLRKIIEHEINKIHFFQNSNYPSYY